MNTKQKLAAILESKSRVDLASICGVSLPTVSKWIKNNEISKKDQVLIDYAYLKLSCGNHTLDLTQDFGDAAIHYNNGKWHVNNTHFNEYRNGVFYLNGNPVYLISHTDKG